MHQLSNAALAQTPIEDWSREQRSSLWPADSDLDAFTLEKAQQEGRNS